MKIKLALVLIITIAFALRFYQLGQNPPSLYWDEVALGYNAYSIAQTGSDEEGVPLPYQYFRSFGDFKPPVYVYAAVPIIKLFGLNEWTTRFPSAFFGTLTVLLTYFLTKTILSRLSSLNKDQIEKEIFSTQKIKWISVVATFLLAISPWHTQISRVAYEANLALFLVVLAVLAFFKGLESQTQKNKYIYLILSSISFILTFYTFNSNRIFTPLLVASLGIIFSKEIFKKEFNNLKPALVACVVGALLFLPIFPHLVSSQAKIRYNEVNIFSDPQPVIRSNLRIERLGNAWWANILNNRRVIYAQNWLDGYFSHFTGKFLFISGDVNPRFSLQDVGELYIIELPFLLIGLYIFAYRWRKETTFILVWMLLAPIPASLAREVPHALRSLNILPTFQIIESVGLIYVLYWIKSKKFKKAKIISTSFITLTSILLSLNMFYYLHNYYVHYPKSSESEWQYGYKQMVQKLKQLQDQYDRIVITDGRGRPYINVLFYLNYPPSQFQAQRQATTDQTGFGFITVNQFSKYEFKGINWKNEIAKQSADEKVLVIGDTNELKEGKYTKAIVKNLEGKVVFIFNELPKGNDSLIELGILPKVNEN